MGTGLALVSALPGPIVGAMAVYSSGGRPIRGFAGMTAADVFVLACVESAVAAYAVWSMYWGVPRAWRWWRHAVTRAGDIAGGYALRTVCRGVVPALVFFYVPLVLGAIYGLLGGAVVEHLACRRIAALRGGSGSDNDIEPVMPG